MFKIHEIIQHQKTGKVGKVIGYGCQVSESTYCLTLKVQVLNNVPTQVIIEDSIDKWFSGQGNTAKLLVQNSPDCSIAA